jgi:hypothetical protein
MICTSLFYHWSKICMSCINIKWHYRDDFLMMYDTQSGITVEDALKKKESGNL